MFFEVLLDSNNFICYFISFFISYGLALCGVHFTCAASLLSPKGETCYVEWLFSVL